MELTYTEVRSYLQSNGLIDANANVINGAGIFDHCYALNVDPYDVEKIMGWPSGSIIGWKQGAPAPAPVRQVAVPPPTVAPRMAYYGDGPDGPVYVQERQAAPIGALDVYGSDPNNIYSSADNFPPRHRDLLALLRKWGYTLPGNILDAWPLLQAQGYSLQEIEGYLGFAPGFLTTAYAAAVAQSQALSPYDNFYATRPASGSVSNIAPAPAPAPVSQVLPAVQAPAPAPVSSTIVPQTSTVIPAPPPPVNTTGPRYNPPTPGGGFWSSQNSGGETTTEVEYGGPYTQTGGGIMPAAQAAAADKSKVPWLLLALAAYLMS